MLGALGGTHPAEPCAVVEGDHRAAHQLDPQRQLPFLLGGPTPQWTIFEIGSSMMSEAPLSLSSGIKVLMPAFGTTVSIANPAPP